MKKKKKQKDNEDDIPKAFKKNKQEEVKKGKRTSKGKRKKKEKSKARKIILISILSIILIFGIYIGVKTHTWKKMAKDMIQNENSIVIDVDGNTLATIGSTKNKQNIKYEEIPQNLKNAYVAIEDERFYKHGGIDIKRTGGAIVSYVFHFGSSSYGGSTITQQLVKNITGDSTSSITRKVKEWWKACQLESCISKDEILGAYLNIIYVGPNVYGVEAGANYYFSKSTKDLTLEECAFLAGINNSPNSYNPFTDDDNTEKIKKRAKTVLTKMEELGYIDEQSCDTAISKVDSGLKFKKGSVKTEKGVYSYHTDALISEVIEDIKDKYNISETFANNYIEMAGLKIYSTQNSKIQNETEKEFEKTKYSLKSQKGGNSSQAAMVIMDHSTGQILACVGGLGKKDEARPLNRATQSIRQTGSSIKPIAVLLPAINKKIITASTIVDDTEKDFADGYHPTDYNKALGNVTIRRSVESSQNIPFVEVMQKLGTKTSMRYLKNMGITTLSEKDDNLTLALGGLDKGISPLQMAGAYATIANNGKYIEPTFYTKIEKNNSVIIKSKQKSKKVVSEDVAYILKQLLIQPVQGTYGTATYCKISGVDVAAKTGTTDENYDRWLCGFTPYYTAVTWYGFDINETINFNKKNPAGLIWANVMSRIHAGLKSATFSRPKSVQSCVVCAETGRKATTACPNTYTEYFLKGTVPDLCKKHNGSELKQSSDNKVNTNNVVHNIINGIVNEIDELDPQEMQQEEVHRNQNTNVNSNTENSTNTNTNSSSSSNSNNVINNDIHTNNTSTIQNNNVFDSSSSISQNSIDDDKNNSIQNSNLMIDNSDS